jgi:hypothetical protein
VTNMTRRWLVGCFVGVLSACGPTSPSDPPSLLGGWAGDHVQLTVSQANAIVEFDCAHGTLDQPMMADRDGRFDVSGTFVREHGGPVRPGEVPDQHPARYAGVTAGQKMTLTVTVNDQPPTVVGPFALVQGAAGRLVKCL